MARLRRCLLFLVLAPLLAGCVATPAAEVAAPATETLPPDALRRGEAPWTGTGSLFDVEYVTGLSDDPTTYNMTFRVTIAPTAYRGDRVPGNVRVEVFDRDGLAFTRDFSVAEADYRPYYSGWAASVAWPVADVPAVPFDEAVEAVATFTDRYGTALSERFYLDVRKTNPGDLLRPSGFTIETDVDEEGEIEAATVAFDLACEGDSALRVWRDAFSIDHEPPSDWNHPGSVVTCTPGAAALRTVLVWEDAWFDGPPRELAYDGEYDWYEYYEDEENGSRSWTLPTPEG